MKPKICVIGLGYVGLPLAHAFARAGYEVTGYDRNAERIEELQWGEDRTNELTTEDLQSVTIGYTANPEVIAKSTIVILAIPTPVDSNNKPDLTLLKDATATVGKYLRKGMTVVYESTVYPGVTEEICGPILEEHSQLRCGVDFKLGYSPERINPGDKEHTVAKIVKVVSGQDSETLNFLAELYGSIVPAGIHRTPNIKVAEMAKAIENAQRDLNIAYINEIAMLCNKMGLETKDVLAAARTKWNFLPFTPGLVGGHCIGVDPYYLLEKARSLNDGMPLVTAARSINDRMALYVVDRILSALSRKHASVLILGLTFKENIPDTRNSKAGEVVSQLRESGCNVTAHDPYVKNGRLEDITCQDAIALLVPHREYLAISPRGFRKLGAKSCMFYDLKSVFPRTEMEKAGFTYMAL
jgi:UDP-N-acetyl-D-galactosamine dehydrogenase